jgi:hypothetical protein
VRERERECVCGGGVCESMFIVCMCVYLYGGMYVRFACFGLWASLTAVM